MEVFKFSVSLTLQKLNGVFLAFLFSRQYFYKCGLID